MLERGEKAGTHLQTDGENEQDQAKLLDELERGVVNLYTQVAD